MFNAPREFMRRKRENILVFLDFLSISWFSCTPGVMNAFVYTPQNRCGVYNKFQEVYMFLFAYMLPQTRECIPKMIVKM